MIFKRFPFYNQLDAMDCGPACLRMICDYYGKKYSLQTIINKSFYTRKGVSLKGLSYAAEELGLKTIGINTNYEKLAKEQPAPFIVYWQQKHFIVVYKITKNHVYISDPEIGKYKLSKNQFIEGWASTIENNIYKGICLLLQPLPQFYSNKSEELKYDSIISFIYGYLKPYKKLLFQLFIGLLLGALIQLLLPFLMQSLVDIGVKKKDLSFVYLILIAQLVLFFSRSIVEIIRSWILLHISARLNISLISDFLIKLMRLPMSYFDSKMVGDLKQRIDDHSRIEAFFTMGTLNMLFSFISIIMFSIVLGLYSLKILSIFYFGAVIYIIWVLLFMKKRRLLDFQRFGQSSETQSKLYSIINNMQEIKLHNAEHEKRWEWENIQAKIFKISIKQLSLSQIQSSGGIFVIGIMNLIITIISAKLVIENKITLGMMLSIQYIIGQLNSPIDHIISFIQSSQDAKISLERLIEVHNKNDEEKNNDTELKEEIIKKDIIINNVSFRYEGPYSPLVLNNINLKICENKVTAIVGTSGSGKTTIMKLILGFYKPTEGEIIIDDTKLDNYKKKFWRNKVGAVMQDGVIFSDTIAKNIALGADNINLERLQYSSELANIHEFIMSLPLKYNTKIGNEGSGLSQGQKQRILIARAVYKNPDYLFLDEATNALDAKSESIIVKNMEEFFKNRTVFIIAHRLSTVKNADNIIVLEKGEIVEEGNHKDLIDKKGTYFNLIQNQLELGN